MINASFTYIFQVQRGRYLMTDSTDEPTVDGDPRAKAENNEEKCGAWHCASAVEVVTHARHDALHRYLENALFLCFRIGLIDRTKRH